MVALIGVMVLSISSVYAGTAYTNGRAFLKQGSPTGGGKVYVASNATEPAASAYKAVTSSTSPAFNVQVAGNATFHYWAVANAGYIFTGWYDANGVLQSSGAAHFSKAVTAGTAGTSDTHAYADYYASFIKQIQMSFVVPTNGSFTITHCGSEVTPAYSSFTTEGKVVLTALPADGYKLRGWYTTTNGGTTKSYFAFGPSCEPNFTSNVTIGAEFVPDDGKATFWIKGTNKIYDNLTDANTNAASSSSKLIVVVSDGTVGAGTYTISSGVTLLIPYEETYNLMTKPNIKHITSATAAARTPSIFRKLTLAPGATINVSGNICIGGSQASVNGGNPSSFPTGPVGMLDLSRGGTINLASGSNLYAWGYVKGQDMDQGNNTAASGVGEINAASGATVWEDYQVGEWRGGTASSTIYNNKGSWKFFPFQSYTVQNIEAPVNYAYGSNLKCYWTIFGNGSVYDVNFPLIASSGSLFKLASGGTVRKWYDPTTDHVCFELGGTAALDALTLSVMGETVSSSDYYLPIPANLKISLKSGNSLTVSKPMTMHAGSVVEVKSGATLNINNKVFLYDADDWDMYCMYKYYYRTYYSPSLHFDRGEGTAKTNLEDATVIVDGTVNVGNQYLYATAHGANICGNGGGTFKYGTLPGNTTMTQCKELKDNVSVNIRSANLHNDNGTYTKGIASKTFKNINGRWFNHTDGATTIKADKTYNFTYIKSGDAYGTGGTDGTVAACWSKDKTGLALQDKWANVKAEGCTDWWTGIDDSHLYNYTRNSAWHQYIKTGSFTTGTGEDAVTTDIYAGSDGKILYKTDCDITEEGTIDANCLYTIDATKKALVNGSFVAVTANASPDHGYHKSDAASTYYLCFEGCVWHPATRNAENLYTVDGTKYIWYGDKWMAVEYDSGVALYYSLSATNVKIYYEYVDHAWVLATPVAEVTTSAGTEQVFSLANAITKAKAGGTNVTIRLLKNMSISTFVYDGANNCGLDLNGFTLSSTTTSAIQTNHASATLIIKDQSAAGTGKINIKFSRSDNKVFGLNVTKGHIVLNSGTVHVENTHASQGACGVVVKTGHKFTMNGGILEIESKGISWGIETESTSTSVVTINGGTIEAKTTSAAAGSSTSGSEKVSGIYSLGGIININGGSLTAIATNAAATYIKAINLGNANSTLTISGGTITASANSTDYGVYVTAGSTANINGGTITASTTAGTSRGVLSYGTTKINTGATITASAGTSNARAIYVANNTTTINAGATITASAASDATGIHYEGASAVVVVNGGSFTVNTTSTTNAYGVNATTGTGTINDGTFTVTAKTTGAYGMYVGTSNTPKLTLNGGKFMVKNSNGSADGTINNTGATLANFSMAGGYFNVAPNGTTNIAAGKGVKDVSEDKEPAIYGAGYRKKIAGNEYTVTWMSLNGKTTFGTTQVESGKVPVCPYAIPDQSTSTATDEPIGWTTAKNNGGTKYTYATMPAIVDADVTYFVRVQTIYAEVTIGTTTTRYTSANSAWTAAMGDKRATIRLLSNIGTESSIGNKTQMVFNPTNANSVITMDLNGHSWTMGQHKTDGVLDAYNTSPFLSVNKAGCKLIITDNSDSGNGYLMNSWAKTDGDLRCVEVNAGELVLQKGGIKVKNTDADHYSHGVVVSGNNAHFTMTGGTVYATDGKSPRGVNVANGYADIAGGTVEAYSTTTEAYALLSYDTVTVSGGATIRATGITGSSQATFCYGAAAVLNIDSAILISNAYQTARAMFAQSGGKITIDGKSSVSATTTTGSGAYAAYITGANTKVTLNDGTYTVTSAANSAYGVFAVSQGKAIVNGGSFTVTATGTTARGVYAENNGVDSIRGGSFNVTSDTHADPSSFGAYAAGGIINIEDGNFTLNVHKDLSNRNCDLARCGTGSSYLNISGGTFAGDSAYHAVRSFGGETMITGNPVFTAQRGVDAGAWASADGTAKVTIDGGTFYCTDNFALYATTHTTGGKTVVGDMTVLDGKFHTKSSIQPIYASSGTDYLKIKGGYFTTYTSSNVSNLTKFVVAPSTTTAVESTDPMYAADYRYRVNTKFTATWKDMAGNTLKTEQYNRNEIPSYGSEYVPSDGNTYTFNGWSPVPGPIQSDQVYTAQYTKWEAEVYEGENPTPTRFQYFTDAFREAQELPVARIKVLSHVYYGTTLTLNPTEAAGSKPLTIDLNNHIVNFTKLNTDYALKINKAGCKLIIDDSSVAKGGQFGHRVTPESAIVISAIYVQTGELELAGGTIIAQNNFIGSTSGTGTRAVVGNSGTVFTQTGGKLYAKSRLDARAFNSGGTGTFNATGGTIEATCEYTDGGTQWGSNAYGVVLWNYGTFNMSGTAAMTVTAGAGALGVYPYGAGGTGYPVVNISGGSINCLTKTGGTARGVQIYGTRATTNISGGDITANGPAGQYNIEDVSCQSGATVNITGGNFHSSTGANCVGVRVFEGTATIGGTAFFDSRHGVVVGDWASSASPIATAYVNGGTFDCAEYVLYARETTNEYDSKNHYSGTVTGTMYVNGGYFKTASGQKICSTSSQTGRLILNGGYYNETSGTTQKSNITTYKGATTEVSTLSPAITVDGRTYHYQLLTDFDITWLGGDSYSKVTTLKSGTTPTNTDLDGKCFLRNDSAFYFSGWSPTPTAVTGDATYNAVGVYHEASVKVGSADPIIYDDFDEAWSYAMDQASATITLLTNLTRTTSLVYNPTPANARHTFDLNNFTIKENTTDRLLVVNKADAKLTITDNSSEKGGCLYKKMNSSANMYTTIIYHGEMILAGGKIYVENTKDDKAWHPALAVHTSLSTDGIFTMTGGTVESQAKYLAYPIYNYATTNISGGTIIANATTQGSALGFYAVAGTATISGGTFNITASTNAIGAIATGWISGDGSNNQQGTLNITGGTFNISTNTTAAHAVQATGTGKKISSTIYTAHGIMNVSGGTFNVTCPPVAAATQVFAAQVNAWRQFDDALPHTLLAEAKGEMNISGGTFTVDARDNGAWVANSGNVDLLRCWGDLNVTGGNFTIHQYSTPSAISVFRGKATVSGNPVFNVYGHTGNAYAVCAGYWTHENYCDKNAANNVAEAEVNGGTFKIITEGQNTNVIYALGQISAESRDGETITAHAGYAMNAKITVNGGEFLGICPNVSGHYPIMLNSREDQVGTYGTAKSEIYVNGGKFKSRKGTEADNTTSGAINCHNKVGTLLLTGGYYETNGQLAAQKADTCDIINITSAAVDPEYNNGYRYRIDIHYVAQVTATGIDRKFATLKGALDYARTVNNSTVTILNDCNFETDGLYGYGLGTTGKTMTIDLNNHTVNATNSVTSYDRVFAVTGQITITDNSVAKGGKLNLTKAHNGTFLGIVFNDASQLTLANGTIYVENTTASKAVEALNIWGTTGIFRQTGGTLQAKATSGSATGVQMRGTAQISGGNITVTSVGSTARAFNQSADAANSKYSSLTVSSTPTITVSGAGEVEGVYDNVAGTTATISGGTWNITSTTSTAYGVRLSKANTATISGGTFNATATTTNAYGVYVSAGGSATVSGGTFTSRTGANKNESFGAYATGTGTTLNITGGTFDANSADNAGGNINVVRVQPGATVTISGGTFRSGATSGYGLVAFGGVTTVSGTALFEAYTGAYVGSWYSGDGTNDELATVNLNGGTFNVKGIAIDATWNTRYKDGAYLDSPFVNSIVNVNGGRYKTTGGTIVRKKADGPDGGTAVLNIAGGYFNEKSGTTFKDQISPYVADTSRINTLDPLLEGIYKYEVAPHYVAKVQTGVTTKYHTTAKAAFDYAKTVANPTITLLDNCTLTEANYMINPAGTWTCTLDLNNFTLTPTVDTSLGRAFTIGGTKAKLIVTDNSEDKGGQIYYKGNSSLPIIYFVMGANAAMELAGGALYVENTNASKKAIGFVVNASTASFTQSGGTFTVKGAYGANGYYGGGTATFTGGTMNVDGGSHQAIGLFPQESTSVLNVSGSFALNVTSSLADSYGVLVKNSGATGTISGGKFKFNQNTMVGAQSSGSLTINGGYFCEHPSIADKYKGQINSYKGSKVIINLESTDAEYIAGYRYLVTDDPVAKVTEGSTITYYSTLASAIEAANEMTNPTVTMLKDASTTQQLISSAMTIDLNGKTITSTESKNKAVFKIDAAVTIKDSGSGGRIERNTAYDGDIYGIYLNTGSLDMQGGAIYANNTTATENANYRAYGIYSKASTSMTISGDSIEAHCPTNGSFGIWTYGALTMTGGKVKADGASTVRGIYTRSTAESPITVSLTDVTVESKATGSNSVAVYLYLGSHVTIHSGTYTATAPSTGYAVYARNYASNITTINDGRFNGSTREVYRAGADASISISGGYYVHNTGIESFCASNHHVLPTTEVSGYNYKVAEAYALTWNLDGGTVTTAGTLAPVDATGTLSGLIEKGASITTPTVTKTGYTFNGWSPSVPAATMPSANTTYTATWTINSYDVTFNMQGHGAAVATQSINYNGLVTEPAAPTEANYVFGGWYKEAGCTNAWNFASDHVTAATTLYAKWIEAEASVTVGGSTTYYETVADAFTAANGAASAPTITMLQDVSGIASSLIYSGSKNCTLDLNHHRITGTVTNLIDVNASGKTFTIDDSSAEKDGTISMIGSGNARLQALYITAGTVNLKHGKIYSKNEAVYASNKSATAAAVYVADGQSFIMDDGTVESEAQYGSYAIYAYEGTSKTKTVTIKGGLVKGHTNLGTTAAGIYARTTKLTVNGGTIIGHAWTSTAYGVYIRSGSATLNGGRIEATNDTISNNGTKTTYGIYARGPITIPAASTVNVYAKARTSTAAAVYVYATITGNTIAGGAFTAKAGTTTARCIHSEGNITISGGTFNVNAASPTSNTNAPCGIYAPRGTVTVEGNPTFNVTSDGARAHGVFAYGTIGDTGAESTKFSGTININGGTFNVTTTTTTAYGAYAGLLNKTVEEAAGNVAGTHYMPGIISITDGTFNVKATTNTAYGIYVAAQQSETVGGVTTDRIPTVTITGGKFNVVSTGNSSKAYAMNNTATNTALRVEGGWYSTKKMDDGKNMETKYTADGKTCNYHVLPLEGESPYMWEVAEAYSLTWNLDGGTVTTAGTMAPMNATGTPSGYVKPGASITAPVIARDGYTFASWSPAVAATMPSSNKTYTAQWALATVTINGVTTPYSDINDAWTAVTSATAASTLTMLQDVSISGKLQYTNTQNCTLDLNGHTITSTTAFQSPLHINRSGITFTITDGTVDKSGKLSMTSSSTSTIFGAYAENGNLVLDAGTIEVISGTQTTCGVSALTTGTFTMNGGTIHVVATDGQIGRGLYFNGTMTVNSGTIHVEAAGDGYGIYRDNSGGTATVYGGKFNITSSSGTPSITNQGNNTNVKIYGGYYNINTQLGTCVSAPKYVFRTTAADKASVGEDYEYKVTTGYVITYNKGANGTGTIASGTKAHGDDFTLSSSTFTRTGYTQTGWSESDGGAKAYELGGTYSTDAAITLYPFWSAQDYTLTLDNQSATTAGTTSLTVTYNSNTNLTATPAITLPTKTGYTFGGYYVKTGGKDKQVIAANGNVNASVSGITDASKNWIAATGGTIYAKWTQTVTLHDNNGGIHNGSLEVTYNLDYKTGTPPTREGYTAEGYYAEAGCTNKVMTTAAVWVNYSGWVEDGKWVHNGESTLYTKWIEDTHTVTVDAGANGSVSPTSVSGVGITTASGTITATPNTGYHFTNWTLPDGVTAASTYSTTSNPIRINATADGKTITANFAANTNTAYTVKHYKQNLDGSYPSTPTETDNLTGTTGASVTPAVKSYTGFTAPSTQTVTILADGSRVVTYNYTRNSYTLAWALDGGSISVAGTTAGSVKYGASLTAPTVTKAGYNFTGWSPSVPSTMPAANSTYTATWEQADLGAWLDIVDVDNTNLKLIVNVTSWAASGWPYTINGVEYQKTAREADRTLKIPYVGTPGANYAIMVKKTGGDVISHHTYVIPQEITSNTTITENQTKNLYVKDGVTLTVNANITAHNIYVAPEAKLAISSGKTLTADSIFLRTTADHAAEMVLSGNLAGTTQLVYTRIIKDKDFHLFGIPLSCPVESVQLSDGFVPTYITGWVLRYYNEKRRSNEGADDNNWATVKADSTITGGSGYELFSGSNYYREFYFPVDHKELTNKVAVVYDMGAAGEKHAGWNAITSPFTSTYTNVKVPEGLAVSWYMGGYYSQEIPTTIPAATVFAFQATKTGTISFEGESIVAALPRRAATEEAVRIQWLDLDITDANGIGDQTSIYSHPTRYDAVFQKGIDIAKQSFEAPRAIIYSSHAYGEMAFAGVADSLLEQGVALTVYSPSAQQLTISMRDNDWLNRMKYVWLIDHQTGERTDLLWENYTYEASEGTTRGRFTIQGVFRTPTITTDIENGIMNGESMQVEKFILNDKIYIRVNGHLYDATGKLVNRK